MAAKESEIRSGVPVSEVIEASGHKNPLHRHLIDNDSARLAIPNRASANLKHLKKHQEVSLRFMRDLFLPYRSITTMTRATPRGSSSGWTPTRISAT